MQRPTAQSATTDAMGHLKIGSAPASERTTRGFVALVNGSAFEELISIYCNCGGVQTLVATADSKGRFSFKTAALGDVAKAKACVLHASLEGYRSDSKALTDLNPKSDRNLGKLLLQPTSSDTSGLFSILDEQAPKGQIKKYGKALDQAAQGDWSHAIGSLEELTSAYPSYSSAWLTLGILQLNKGDRTAAKKSLLESMRSDPKFASPLIQAAALEASQGDWPAALDHSQQAITLNPAAFPDAYAWNAMANLTLQHIDAAEKSAQVGLRLDTDHQYPELEYALGILLYSKGDVAGAAQHLQAYVSRSQNGPNAVAARSELAQVHAAGAAAQKSSSSSDGQTGQLQTPSSTVEEGPAIESLQDRNAALLMKTPAHTCLESIARTQIDTRGRTHNPDLTRVQIAISGDKEIYGDADGKRFANGPLADILGYSFSSTGLFSSIARALIAGNNATIEFAGKSRLNGESLFRYNFHVLPGQAGWWIQYGKESGQAGEEGSFYVDGSNLILRRVVVHTIDMPQFLKLTKLEAAIDYEPETIAGQLVILPYVAEVHAEERAGTQRVSRMFFNHCRAFSVESTISFDVDSSHTQDATASGKSDLPTGLDVTVSLLSPVSESTASEHDLLAAAVVNPVLWKGHEIIARGAVIEGHVLRRLAENAVIIELDRVKTRSGWAPFYAHLVSVEPVSAQVIIEGAAPQKAGLGRRLDNQGVLADPEIPGVATIHFDGRSAELAAGTTMVWKTESLVAPAEAGPPQLNTSMGLR
ncbi:MAG: hypothetical protein M3Y72_20575 [Acidobacteriota bacterium]|nr:hypothetical protein [Acidobacteriota bacterium]